MVSEHLGRRRGPGTSEAFLTLYRHSKLGMGVEAWVLQPEYAPLFTEDERAVARRRLTDHQFDVDRCLRSLPTA